MEIIKLQSITIKILLLAVVNYIHYANAQGNYNVSIDGKPYQNIEESTSLNQDEIWDDPDYIIPIGFEFQIADYIVDTIYIPEWGGGGVLSSTQNEEGDGVLLYPIGQDIIDLGYWSPNEISESNISYVTEGNLGSRILKIEWNNIGFWDDNTESDFVNFQVWFYEETNNIEYHYGSSFINNPQESFEGIGGPIVAFFPSVDIETYSGIYKDGYILSGSTENPSIQVITPEEWGEEEFEFINGMISEDTELKFVPTDIMKTKNNTLENMIIYPNPVVNDLYITTKENIIAIRIYDLSGRNIKEYIFSENNINVSSLAKGVYFIEITTASGKMIKRFQKE